MREQIEILASLQNLDREIQTKMTAKQGLLSEIDVKKREIEAKRADLGLLKAGWQEKDQLRQTKERILQEEGRKATEKRMRIGRIKNIKELQALQREIDQIKQNNSQLEEELILVLEELEKESTALKEREQELRGLEEEVERRMKEVEAQISEIEEKVNEASKIREETAARLNGDLIRQYELIFSRCRGMAVVAVSDGTCRGCHMNIRPQLWNEIIRSDRVILCPSCHRILYYQPPVSEDGQP